MSDDTDSERDDARAAMVNWLNELRSRAEEESDGTALIRDGEVYIVRDGEKQRVGG